LDEAEKAEAVSEKASKDAATEKKAATETKKAEGVAANETTAEDVAAEADKNKSSVLKYFARDKVDQVVENYNRVLNNTQSQLEELQKVLME